MSECLVTAPRAPLLPTPPGPRDVSAADWITLAFLFFFLSLSRVCELDQYRLVSRAHHAINRNHADQHS